MKLAVKYGIIILFVPLLLMLGGCPQSGGSTTALARLETTEYASDHYRVQIVGFDLNNETQERTREAALLMEKMFAVYAGLEEMPLPPGDEMPIWLHLVRREYDRQAALYDFPPGMTTGFCNTDGEVHVYYQRIASLGPEATLLHEGFHQYCHRAVHLPTPPEVFQRVPNYQRRKLATVPLWLAEGMAMNMETGRVTRDHNGFAIAIDDIGAVNRDRLRQLVEIIKSNRAPSARDIMNKIMGDQITADDYAVMWGLVFDFRMATGNAIFVREQKELERAGPGTIDAAIQAATDPFRSYPYMRWPVPVTGRFLRACRVAWGIDVPQVVEASVAGANSPRDFDRQWNRAITQAAFNEVERLLKDQGQTLEQWEQAWRLRMLTLQTEVRGGKYVYIEPSNIQSTVRRMSPGRANQKTGVWN